MSLFEWSKKYSTGIRAIDNDHKSLFSTVNLLHDSIEQGKGDDRFLEVIRMLEKYVDEHFVREERFMRLANYPEFKEHCAEHRKFTNLILGLAMLHEREPETVDKEKVLDRMAAWLRGHILGVDMKFIPYMKGEHKHEIDEAALEMEETPQIVQMTISVDKNRAELIKGILNILEVHNETAAQFETAIQDALEKIETHNMARARKLFTKDE